VQGLQFNPRTTKKKKEKRERKNGGEAAEYCDF
jgi:hypothetical protein